MIRFVFSIFNFIFYFIKLYLFFYSNDYKEPMIETTTISNNDIVKTNFTYHNSHSYFVYFIFYPDNIVAAHQPNSIDSLDYIRQHRRFSVFSYDLCLHTQTNDENKEHKCTVSSFMSLLLVESVIFCKGCRVNLPCVSMCLVYKQRIKN